MGLVKVVGLWSGHDTSFAVFEDGRIRSHSELERHTRLKEDFGNVFDFWKKNDATWNDPAVLVSCYPTKKLLSQNDTGRPVIFYGHHLAHAAHAYYSSPFDDALVFTFDGGGLETDDESSATSCTVFRGKGLDLENLKVFPISVVNIGGVWTRATKYVFGYESGWPQGHQAGTVMALAALGKSSKYEKTFLDLLSKDMQKALFTPEGHVKGMSVNDPRRPTHPFLGHLELIARQNEQEKFDMALGLQSATETNIRDIMRVAFEKFGKPKNVCLAGGVCLNSLAMGKIREWFPFVENVYIPPCPYDAGLSLGAAQYHTHHVMRLERPDYGYCFPAYLGRAYSETEIRKAISDNHGGFAVSEMNSVRDVAEFLNDGRIISVFNSRAESGRRALGNRSILADPRKASMKDRVNEKVKHRQWFRPFAPSVLREDAHIYFENAHDSPYMSFVARFSEEGRKSLPAVVHFDGTGRLQTVTADSNPWYYDLLKAWKEVSGVSVILNTSFNDKEPICETPDDAIKCFVKTDIDMLYFAEIGILLKKDVL